MAALSTRFVGKSIARKEDARFLTGHGRFVDDITLPNLLHVAFARSDLANARIVSIDTSEAAALPGVVAVFLAADINPRVLDYTPDDEMGAPRPFRALADGDVRCVGEPYAMVIAESRYVAEDALELLVVDFDPLPAVVEIEQALADDAPVVHPERGTNLYATFATPEDPELEAVFADAPVVLTETFKQHSYSTVPMETRGLIASWEPFEQQLNVWAATQGPHGLRSVLARCLGIDDSQVRVIMPDVGGSFGLKMHPCPEEFAVTVATHILGRPVKWIQDRRENLMGDNQARRDNITMTFAADEEGHVLAAKIDFLEGAGAYPCAMSTTTMFSAMLFTGPYKIPKVGYSSQSVNTNTFGRGGYRAPWMIDSVGREQMMDALAAHLGIDPLEIRRRNVIQMADLPYAMPSGMVYDQMTAVLNLEQAAELVDYEALREQQRQWREDGRLIGVGVSLFPEPSANSFGYMTSDAATVRIGNNGKVDVLTSTGGHGQSLETTIAQVVADALGVEMEDVRVMQGDTDATPVGGGTGGSRSAVISGTAAVQAAEELRTRAFAIAAHSLEAAPEDFEVVSGRIQVAGTPTKGMSYGDVARLAYTQPAMLPPGVPLGMEAQSRYAPSNFCTWSNACHICVVEVDGVTGKVDILRYVVSEDCGVMINPNVVEGQIAGGVLQGLGGALYEQHPYDEFGNPLATTFMDYLLPTASEAPTIEYGHVETFAPTNPGGHKGMGEGGAIGAPPAVCNAVADALAPLGVKVRSQPLGPNEIVELIASAAP
jgi:carbon-monoxide dehydrogenase large subunit